MSEQTSDEVTALKVATREAHEAIRDLRILEKQIRDLRAGVPALVRAEVENIIRAEVAAGLESLSAATGRAMSDAVARVEKSFERLERIYLGQDGGPAEDLETLSRQAAAARRVRGLFG